jgi:general secretion pathway protein D
MVAEMRKKDLKQHRTGHRTGITEGVLIFILFLLIVPVYGCTEKEKREDKPTPVAQGPSKPATPEKAEKWEWQITEEKAAVGGRPRTTEATIPVDLSPPVVELRAPVGEEMDVSMTFHSADIATVLEVLLGELLDVNYIIGEEVGGKLTFRMVGKFYKEEMLNIIQGVLNVNNLAMVQRDGLIEVVLLGEAKLEASPLTMGKTIRAKGANLVTQVVPLHYTVPQAILPTIRAFLTPSGIAMSPSDSHVVVIVDKASNVSRLVAMTDSFDIPFFGGKAVKFYDVTNVNVANLAKDLEALAVNLGAPPKGPQAQVGFIPLEDSNKLLVAVADPEMLATVDFWVKQMDVESPGGAQIYIYKLQHKKAESMANIISELFTGSAGTSSKVTRPDEPVQTGPSIPQVLKSAASQAGPVTVIADAESNSLVMRALPKDYQNIRRIIEIMDATPKQVLIEVLIAEVTLTDALEFGVEYFLQEHQYGIASSLLPAGIPPLDPVAIPEIIPSVGSTGGTKGIFISPKNPDLTAIVTLLDTTTDVEVLSTPRILVRHEQKAVIQVGQEEPILTQELQEADPAQAGEFITSNTVEYKDIGIILTVTPRIGENRMITLDVTQEVTSIQSEVTQGIDSPRFTTRKATTSLVVEDGRTIIIAGIIESRYDNIVKKIPVISRIPVLGHLFKSENRTKKKTELMLVLTPRVVNNSDDADRLTQEFERKLEAIEKLRSKTASKGSVAVQ